MAPKLTIQADTPCDKDQLGFDDHVETIYDMIVDKDFKTPFCIGIFGKWGIGKTSFLQLLQSKLSESTGTPVPIPIWFTNLLMLSPITDSRQSIYGKPLAIWRWELWLINQH